MFDDPVVFYNRLGIGTTGISASLGISYFLFDVLFLGVATLLLLITAALIFWRSISIKNSAAYSDWLDFLCDEGKTPDEIPFDLFAPCRGNK